MVFSNLNDRSDVCSQGAGSLILLESFVYAIMKKAYGILLCRPFLFISSECHQNSFADSLLARGSFSLILQTFALFDWCYL